MRFLFPVYLIDEVETSIWDATANRTLENSETMSVNNREFVWFVFFINTFVYSL